jgi:Ca-activated chloride channel family protein
MKQTAWAVERDAEHGREVLLLVTLEADAEAPRAPVAINLALDRSASMRGIPLLSAVQAAQTLVERASPRDYLGLLTFDAEPEQVLPMRAMEPNAKAQFLKVLSRLESGEGTALHEAVERAAEAGRRVLVPGARPQVLMLTDGEPSVGPSQLAEFKTLGARVAESGVMLHALGLGRHYLPDILEALTSPSGTGFVHVDDAEGLPMAVGQLGAELFGEVVSDARVYVLPTGFADLRCRHRYPARVEGDAMSATLGAVSQAFPRRVLFSGLLGSAEWNMGVSTSFTENGDTRRITIPVTRILPDSDQGRYVQGPGPPAPGLRRARAAVRRHRPLQAGPAGRARGARAAPRGAAGGPAPLPGASRQSAARRAGDAPCPLRGLPHHHEPRGPRPARAGAGALEVLGVAAARPPALLQGGAGLLPPPRNRPYSGSVWKSGRRSAGECPPARMVHSRWRPVPFAGGPASGGLTGGA